MSTHPLDGIFPHLFVLQVWDVYLSEGEVYLLCVALGILKMFAPRLSVLAFENITLFLLHLPAKMTLDELMDHVSQITRKISVTQYEKTRDKMRIKCGVAVSGYNGERSRTKSVCVNTEYNSVSFLFNSFTV